jgi:hypothetical protein
VTEAVDSQRSRADRAVWTVIALAVALFWLISTSWRPWNLFAEAGFSADFYDEQARSFIRGRLAVRPEVPGPEGFLIDGNTYLYYGPFLAIVRVPLALFGDLFVGRMVRLSMLIALVVLGRWSARLAVAGRRVVRSATTHDADTASDPDRDTWVIPLFVGAVLFSPALFASGWISVYHETEIWALALAVVSITLLAEWAAGGFADRRMLLWGSGAVLATTMTRAPIGLGLAMSLGLIGLILAWRSRSRASDPARRPDTWLPIAGGIAPLAAYAAVNVAKFGTLFSVPGDRQLLSLTDPTRAAFFETTGGSFFSPHFLPTTLAQYLRPDTIRFERLVPGIRFGPLAENYGSIDVETVTPASSLIVSATLLLALAIVGAISMLRHRAMTWLTLVAGATIGAIPTFMIGFIANRYLIDMLPPLIAAGAVGVWIVARLDRTRAVKAIGVVLVVWGAWVNAALATWTLESKTPGFTELRSDIDRAVFGGGDVGIEPTAPGSPVPRDGRVGIADGCAGVYIAEQGNWVALERAPGIFETSGTVTDVADGPVRLAQTSAWTIDLLSLSVGGFAVVYSTPADPDVLTIPVESGLPVDYRIVTDPITGETFIEVADSGHLLPGDATDSVGPGIAPTLDAAAPRHTPLCDTLLKSGAIDVLVDG